MKINFFSESLKNKLIFSHILTAFIVIMLVLVIIYSVAVSMQLKDAVSFDSQIVRQISTSLDNMIITFKRVFDTVSMNRELQGILQMEDSQTQDGYVRYLSDVRLYSIAVEQTIFVNELDGLYLYDNKGLRTYFDRYYTPNKSEKSYQALELKRFNGDGSVTWQVEGDAVLFNREIKNMNSLETIGYLTMTMNKNHIQENINTIRSNQNRFIIITDAFDNIIVRNLEMDNDKLAKILGSITQQSSDESRIQDIEFIGESLVTVYQSRFSGWKIISVIGTGELTKGPVELVKWIYVVGMIGFALAIGISLLSSNRLVKPLKSLVYLMDEIEKENFNVKQEITGNDEIGKLGKSFNSMASRINYLISKVYQEEISLKKAEIKALQAQINPHFLYNTLDCINWLAEFGRIDDIRCVTMALADLMKASANNNRKMVTVACEIDYIKAYLSIYKISLQDRFNYNIDIDEGILSLYMPKLILQPVVENAVIHGLKEKMGCGNLHINGFIKDNQIILQVFDDGVGMREDVKEWLFSEAYIPQDDANGTGSGLRNARDRIRLINGDEYGIRIESIPRVGTMIEINLPVQEKEGE